MNDTIAISLMSGFVLAMLIGPANAEAACGTGSKAKDLCACKVLALRPTQMAVGMIEVRGVEEDLAAKKSKKLDAYLRKNPEPAVKGPGAALFITDHHHLARAAADIKVDTTYCMIQADYSGLAPGPFWDKMKEQNWVYPYDENGKPHEIADLPQTVEGLKDDPYRSLAGAVRHNGGYAKSPIPFAEFKWADYFRPLIKIELINANFGQAVQTATEKAKAPEACALPGYIGAKKCQ